MPRVAKLPKWAIKQAGGINKKAWRLARSRRRKTSNTRRRKTTTKRSPRRRTSSPKRGRTMSRRKKSFNIPLIQSVAGLAIGNIAVKGITTSRLVDNPVATITAAGQNLMNNKDDVIKLGLGSLVAQFVATEVLRKKTIGSIGPIKLKA